MVRALVGTILFVITFVVFILKNSKYKRMDLAFLCVKEKRKRKTM